MGLIAITKGIVKGTTRTIIKHAPELLIGAGIVGSVGATVLACRATLKLDDIIDEHKEEVDRLKQGKEDYPEEYTDLDYKKDLSKTYTQTTMKVIKLYAPAVALGTASIAAIVGSHKILSARCVALATTLTSTFEDFKNYRARVIDDLGKEADRKYRFGEQEVHIVRDVEKEDGSIETIEEDITLLDGRNYSKFAKFYDEGCREWTKDPEYNMSNLLMRQAACNDLLRAKGHLFLNEVYDELGIPRTKAGQLVGWIYDPECPNGDNYIDFGIYSTHRANRDFINGYEPVILLDFNVDGVIIDKI